MIVLWACLHCKISFLYPGRRLCSNLYNMFRKDNTQQLDHYADRIDRSIELSTQSKKKKISTFYKRAIVLPSLLVIHVVRHVQATLHFLSITFVFVFIGRKPPGCSPPSISPPDTSQRFTAKRNTNEKRITSYPSLSTFPLAYPPRKKRRDTPALRRENGMHANISSSFLPSLMADLHPYIQNPHYPDVFSCRARV